MQRIKRDKTCVFVLHCFYEKIETLRTAADEMIREFVLENPADRSLSTLSKLSNVTKMHGKSRSFQDRLEEYKLIFLFSTLLPFSLLHPTAGLTVSTYGEVMDSVGEWRLGLQPFNGLFGTLVAKIKPCSLWCTVEAGTR